MLEARPDITAAVSARPSRLAFRRSAEGQIVGFELFAGGVWGVVFEQQQ